MTVNASSVFRLCFVCVFRPCFVCVPSVCVRSVCVPSMCVRSVCSVCFRLYLRCLELVHRIALPIQDGPHGADLLMVLRHKKKTRRTW